MSYIDALKCEEFQNDPSGHFESTKVINFARFMLKLEENLWTRKPRILIKVYGRKISRATLIKIL